MMMSSDANAKSAPAGAAAAVVIPLSATVTGQEVALVRVDTGRAMAHRLAEMGLIPGVHFRIVTRGWPGPFVIAVKNTRLVIGRGMVDRVLVRPV
jgi:ferrous iron transport protein A